ncbi:VWA domain-containing protein [Mariniluteicoccus flavus]
MTDADLTHIEFLLDRSGSMVTIADDVRGGFDAFIAEQRAQEGECTVSLAQFDNEYEAVFTALPIDRVRPLELHPRGSTAMLDAIGRSVIALGDRLRELPEDRRPASVIVAIMTDGLENSSTEFTYDAIKTLISQQEDAYGWTFMYMGSDQDAIEVGAKMGIQAGRAMTYDRGQSADSYTGLASSVSRYREAVRGGAAPQAARIASAFTEEERRRSAGN